LLYSIKFDGFNRLLQLKLAFLIIFFIFIVVQPFKICAFLHENSIYVNFKYLKKAAISVSYQNHQYLKNRHSQHLEAGALNTVPAEKGMHVAVVGAGFAGLGTAYHLLNLGANVTIFDPCSVGTGGASAVAAGLLHPLSPRGKLSWKGVDGFQATLELVKQADLALEQAGLGSCIACRSIIRPFFNQQHQDMFSHLKLPQWVIPMSAETFFNKIGGPSSAVGACQIRGALAVDSPRYLQGLWMSCLQQNTSGRSVTWVHQHIPDPWQLFEMNSKTVHFDAVVVAAGAGVMNMEGLTENLGLKLVRGQTLHYDAKQVALSDSLLCGEYLMPKGNVLIGGATSEYARVDSQPDIQFAVSELSSKLEELLPTLKGVSPLLCQAGVRVISRRTNIGKIPVTQQIVNHNTAEKMLWVFSGLGARGLLYHALLGKYLATTIVNALNK